MSDEFVDPKRLVFPGLARLYRSGSTYAYAFMRFCTGAVLVPHGVEKLMHLAARHRVGSCQHGLPFPELLAWLTVLTEFFARVVPYHWPAARVLLPRPSGSRWR